MGNVMWSFITLLINVDDYNIQYRIHQQLSNSKRLKICSWVLNLKWKLMFLVKKNIYIYFLINDIFKRYNSSIVYENVHLYKSA